MNCINNGAMAAMAAALSAKSSMGSDKTQMHLYLDRLKAMVPQCPKNRKVSRQELIEHVIDYISDLQDTLQSDSDSDSSPGSPMDDVSFSDSFDQQPQYGGYGLPPAQYSAHQDSYCPDAKANNVHQAQYGAVYQNGYSTSSNGAFGYHNSGFNNGTNFNYGNGYSDSSNSPGYSSHLYSMQ